MTYKTATSRLAFLWHKIVNGFLGVLGALALSHVVVVTVRSNPERAQSKSTPRTAEHIVMDLYT